MGSRSRIQLSNFTFHFSLSCTGEGNGNPLRFLAWRIPGTEEPGRLPSLGSHRVGHDRSNLAAVAAASGMSGKESSCQCRRHKRREFDLWVGKISQRRKWQPTPVFLPGKFHGQRCLMGYSLWGRKELNTIEHAYTYIFSLNEWALVWSD